MFSDLRLSEKKVIINVIVTSLGIVTLVVLLNMKLDFVYSSRCILRVQYFISTTRVFQQLLFYNVNFCKVTLFHVFSATLHCSMFSMRRRSV